VRLPDMRFFSTKFDRRVLSGLGQDFKWFFFRCKGKKSRALSVRLPDVGFSSTKFDRIISGFHQDFKSCL